ncbi:MAG TPA: hypothetical protein EYP21_02460, partial [Syntrophaceae bacterium]|nr:hypothetical protein [Syntrophaceae bacterium]
MEFWEIITLGGTMGTILGLFLTLYAIINSKALKEQSRLTRESIREESRLTRESVTEVIKEESRLTREFLAEILDRIDKRAE